MVHHMTPRSPELNSALGALAKGYFPLGRAIAHIRIYKRAGYGVDIPGAICRCFAKYFESKTCKECQLCAVNVVQYLVTCNAKRDYGCHASPCFVTSSLIVRARGSNPQLCSVGRSARRTEELKGHSKASFDRLSPFVLSDSVCVCVRGCAVMW